MASKSFWVPWYPKDAFIGNSVLTAEQIGVLHQIINLIYHHNAPIKDNPKYIGKSCNITAKKCARIIQELLKKQEIQLTEEGEITHGKCIATLENVKKLREKHSKNGEKGAKARWEKEEFQELNFGQVISHSMANTPYHKQRNKNQTLEKSTNRPFNIEDHLSEEAWKEARKAAQGLDLHFLIREFNQEIANGREPPTIPHKAFVAWCKKYAENQSMLRH